MKKFFKSSLTALIGFATAFSFIISSSLAIELDDATRTVVLSSTKAVTITPEQVKRGKRLFLNTCSVCHTGGITKTNPNVGLDTEALSLATPTRNTIEGLVDYIRKHNHFFKVGDKTGITERFISKIIAESLDYNSDITIGYLRDLNLFSSVPLMGRFRDEVMNANLIPEYLDGNS